MTLNKVFSTSGLIILLIAQSLNGQTFRSGEADKIVIGSKLVRINPKNKNIQYIQLRDDAIAEEKNQTSWLGKALKTSDKHSFKEISRSTDKINFTHTKYQLYYKDLPVEGAIYSVHSKAGKIVSASGDYTPGNDLNEIPRLSEPDAFESAVKFVHAKEYRWEKEKSDRPKGRLVILPVEGKYLLAYKYDIYALQPLSRQYIFIDADSGVVLETLNRIHEDNTSGTAETIYNGTVSITTDSFSGSFRLRETGRGDGIETYDLNKGTDYSASVDFTDDDNYWNTSTDYDNAAYDAHYAAEATYDYYFQKFGRFSYDDNGTKMISYVHYSENYNNAFWNGECMTYGDGDAVRYYPWTSMEIVAHEITHGVTETAAGLIYKGESGALNESFSDIFGVTVDFYKNPATANYQNGEAISLTHTPLRDMSNPNSRGHPDTYKGSYWDPNQEVHCNSGVQNFWYYLICEGGTGTNDNGNSYQVNAIGRDKAAQIAYRNLTVYLTPGSNYADARFYSIQAAIDLFGGCSDEVNAVGNAWYAVGVGELYDCLDPQNFTAVPISISQINLNWTKDVNNNNVLLAYSTTNITGAPVNGTVYSEGSSIPGGAVVIYSGSATNFNHTGLNPGTRYYYRAWSIKSGYSYTAGVSSNAFTYCVAFSLPFSEGFEGGDIPDCWTQETGPPTWKFISGNGSNSSISEAHEGLYNAYISDNSPASDRNKLISPPLNINGYTHPVLRFWHAQDSALNYDAFGRTVYEQDELRVYYKTSKNSPWNLLKTYTDNIDLWTEVMINLPDPGSDYYIAFEGDNKAGNGVYIDDIRVFDLTCSTLFSQASDFVASDITSGSMNISWTRGNGDEVLVVASRNNPVNADPVNGELYAGNTVFGKGDLIGTGNYVIYRGTGTKVSISDCLPGSEYYFSVYEKSSERCYLTPALTGNAITKDCTANAIPFIEDFEHESFPPACWLAYRGSDGLGVVNDWVHSTTGYKSKGAALVQGENVTEGLAEDWLITPLISIPHGPIFSLSFFETTGSLTDHGGQYYIKISTQSQTDRATFTDLIQYGESTFGIGYNQRSIDLSAYAGKSVYIAFVMIQNGGSGWYIDNVSVDNSYPKTYVTWLGTTSSDWNTGTNWSAGSVPTFNNNVVIPPGCSYYPIVDEIAACNNLTIHNDGSMDINNGASFNVNGDITLGTGSSGSFKMIGGDCSIKGDILTSAGNVLITDGEITFSNWAEGNYGSIQLTGGIINVTRSVYFEHTNVTMDGPFELNIGENYFSGKYETIPDGTINLLGTGNSPQYYFIPAGDYPVRVYKLTINAPGKTYIFCREHRSGVLFIFNNLTIASGTAQTYNGSYNMTSLAIFGNIIIEKGATLAGSGKNPDITLTGDWINNGGTFIPGHTFVNFSGKNQKITGVNTFSNFDKRTPDQLTFGTGSLNKTTIIGNLILQGYNGQLLSLRSAMDGIQWEIDLQGTSTLSYIDVKDSKNTNTTKINGCNLVNSGNNTNWNLPVTAAGTISGITSVCKGSSNIIYTVPVIGDADSYIWTLPPGASGVSTTNCISVNFGNNSTSGDIIVKGRNDCGDGSESTLAVTVNEIPANPVITFANGILQSNATNGNQWYFNNEPLQNAVNSTLIPLSYGDYFVIVTVNDCSSQPSNIISCIVTGTSDEVADGGVNVYPNPASDGVKIAINKKFDSDFFVDFYDNLGVLLKTLKKNESEIIFDIDLSKFSAGFYIIRLYNTNKYYQVKILKK